MDSVCLFFNPHADSGNTLVFSCTDSSPEHSISDMFLVKERVFSPESTFSHENKASNTTSVMLVEGICSIIREILFFKEVYLVLREKGVGLEIILILEKKKIIAGKNQNFRMQLFSCCKSGSTASLFFDVCMRRMIITRKRCRLAKP